MKLALIASCLLFLTGCPLEEENCEKVMRCDDDVEMLCDKND